MREADGIIKQKAASELVGSSIFERLSPHEMGEMFDWEG